jgi:hypothetical protein
VYRDKGERTLALDHFRQSIDQYGRITPLPISERDDLADVWAGLAAVSAELGQTTVSCDAFRRAFVTYRSLAASDRRGADDPEDPLPAAAQSAARCGDADATRWLRAQSESSPH